MKPTAKQIEEIGDTLECGMRFFFSIKTGEIKDILNLDSWDVIEEEFWEEVNREIEANQKDYAEFEGFDSRESYQIMADFAESIDNTRLQDKLIDELNRPKPFQNFKW